MASSCVKPVEKPRYKIPQEVKDFIMFPEGSYWVYQDSVSGAIDSHHLHSFILYERDNNRDYYYEIFNQNLSRSFYNDTIYGGGANNAEIGDVIVSKYHEISAQPYRDFLFFSPSEIGDIYSGEIEFSSAINDFTMNSKQYSDIKIFNSLAQKHPIQTKKIYFAKDVGIIKRVEYSGKVWELTDYQIVQ